MKLDPSRERGGHDGVHDLLPVGPYRQQDVGRLLREGRQRRLERLLIYNTGADEHGTSESIYDYAIAVPDTVTACTTPGGCTGGAPDPSGDPVPVPGMAGLFALAAAGLIGLRRHGA